MIAVPAYIAFLSQRLTGGDLKAARIAKYVVDTALKELEYKVRCKELVSREAVEKEFFNLARTARDQFFNVPDTLTKKGQWNPLPPGSVGRRLMEVVCKK